MTKNGNPAAGCTASGVRDDAFAKRRYSPSKRSQRKQFFFLHVDDEGTEHRLLDELPGASVRVERYGNYETTWMRHVHRTSDDSIIHVTPRGEGWTRLDDGYDYDGATLWHRMVPS